MSIFMAYMNMILQGYFDHNQPSFKVFDINV